MNVDFEATEKLYADFQLLATNPGGHSSLPGPTMPSITLPTRSPGCRSRRSRSN